MQKNWILKLLGRGVVFIIVILLILIGLAPSKLIVSGADLGTGSFSGLESDPLCSDSDGGQNGFEAGFVEGVGPNGYPFKKYDTCDDVDGVKEFYCNGTIPWPVRIDCELGCLDGACLSDCTDGDEDGFSPQGGSCGLVDCDDTDPLVNPGNEEVCGNGLDDDCNGLLDDEDPACVVCTDLDGDGFAVEGGLCGALDCNDDNFDVNPNVIEVCDNGIDDDCDGAVDDDDSQCLGTNTIVIGWDGTQRDHFWECYNAELPECSDGLPNTQALFGESIFNIVTTSGGTATKPGWVQIFSGYSASTTGVISNSIYQPLAEGFSTFEKAENHFGPDNIVTIFLSGKSVHTGAACIGEETTNAGVFVIEDKGQPWCITRNFLDYYENDLRLNDIVGNRALELLDLHKDELIYAAFIFREPDVIGHLAGENSYHYTNSLLKLDEWLGKIADKLTELNILENTKIYLVSDHGFDEDGTRHGNAPYTFMATNDPLIIRGGDLTDIGVTILEGYGIPLDAVGAIPAVDGFPLTLNHDFACVEEGNPFYDYSGAPVCCAGLTVIGFDFPLGATCVAPSGGSGDTSGYCTDCGNGICEYRENSCNCASDCN